LDGQSTVDLVVACRETCLLGVLRMQVAVGVEQLCAKGRQASKIDSLAGVLDLARVKNVVEDGGEAT
jgi:hypothetical protein